jgi:MoaA/NifB/PqqE/SkfB family radical SAM enzyme
VTATADYVQTAPAPYRRLWAELTNKCQLECLHCYAESGPGGGHGIMSAHDWMNLADQAANDRINMIQFIGGEPTMHPRFVPIMTHALNAGLDVEVYSNMVHITDEMVELFQSPGVSLAFSYYAQERDGAQQGDRAPQP